MNIKIVLGALALLATLQVAGWTGVGWVLALIWALHPAPADTPLRARAAVIQLHRAASPPS